MSDTELFERRRFEEVGLSMEIHRTWPLESTPLEGGLNTYQRVADTLGLVFLRHGQRETFEVFVESLSDLVTTVSVTGDEAIAFCGSAARRLTLLQHRQSMGVYHWHGKDLVHSQSPEISTVISLVAFTHRRLPVLVGYRIPSQHLGDYRAILERIVESVEPIV